jgi:hypothetical protein
MQAVHTLAVLLLRMQVLHTQVVNKWAALLRHTQAARLQHMPAAHTWAAQAARMQVVQAVHTQEQLAGKAWPELGEGRSLSEASYSEGWQQVELAQVQAWPGLVELVPVSPLQARLEEGQMVMHMLGQPALEQGELIVLVQVAVLAHTLAAVARKQAAAAHTLAAVVHKQVAQIDSFLVSQLEGTP